MPIQAPHWMEFLSCPICCHEFNCEQRSPVSLGCSHTFCQSCLSKLKKNQCPYDQNVTSLPLDQLPVNSALLSLLSNESDCKSGSLGQNCDSAPSVISEVFSQHYISATKDLQDLALLLKLFAKTGNGVNGNVSCVLSRPMQRKLVSLINCQLVEDEGRARAIRAARSLGERSVTELILHHQNHHQLSSNLWAAVRSRGCQFLGPAMQEEVLKLVLLALEDGSALSRKVLVMFVVQRLEPHFPQASKTSIGHVVQLLYRASCFMVHKREADSSLMQLKEEFRTYDALRREHDAQIVQIATEAGLRIAPDQWSSLLYGDIVHKSHMQSIMDKLQTPQSFGQSVQELVIALQRTGDPGHLFSLKDPLETLSALDPTQETNDVCDWALTESSLSAVKEVVLGLVKFIQEHGNRKLTEGHCHFGGKFKTSLCRDLTQRGGCPRGKDCTFAHTEGELVTFRSRNRKQQMAKNHADDHNFPHPPQFIVPQQSDTVQGGRIKAENKLVSKASRIPTDTSQNSIDENRNSDSLIVTTPRSIPQTTNSHFSSVHMMPPPTASKVMVNVPRKESSYSRFEDSDSNHHHHHHHHHSRQHYSSFQLVEPSSPLPVLAPVEASPNLIRHPPIAQMASTRPPIYAAMLPEYTYQMIHSQTPMFAAPTQAVPPPSVLHPVAGPLANVYSPSSRMLPADVITPSPQQVLINQSHHVVNVFGPSREFAVASGLHSAVPQVTELSLTSTSDVRESTLFERSLVELTERKEELLCRLNDIVGEEAMDEINTQIVNGKPLETTTTPANEHISEFSSTYCIWTSGADFSHITRPKTINKRDEEWSLRYKQEYKPDEESKDGRTNCGGYPQQLDGRGVLTDFPSSLPLAKPFQFPPNPIQVSACNTTDPITTPVVYRPVPAISPMPQMLFQPMTAFVIRPSIDAMNTIGHGIIDPPHLHMSQLEPSGLRPSDPIADFLPIEEEERQRQQFIAAKENGRAAEGLTQKFEEMKLKKELNQVIQDITEKKKELRENDLVMNTAEHPMHY